MGFCSQRFRFEGGGRNIRIGLNRTGKNCRLRWVNYLHPGLKCVKMTPQEELLVLEFHAKLGNRWSKIARRLLGRTVKELFEDSYEEESSRKEATYVSKFFSSSSSMNTAITQDTGGSNGKMNQEFEDGYYSMDEIWREIDESGENVIKPVQETYYSDHSYYMNLPSLNSPTCESSLESIWNLDADESKMSCFAIDQFPLSFEHYGRL